MKRLSLIVCFIYMAVYSYGQISSINDFYKAKINFYSEENPSIVISEIEKIIEQNKHENFVKNNELALTIENLLLIEKINFQFDDTVNHEEIYLSLNTQNLKNELFIKDKKLTSFSTEYLTSFADLKTRLLSYLSQSEMYKESMFAKELYMKGLKKNKKSSIGLSSYALWLYFAPPVAGGGYAEALKNITLAEKYAINNEELFFALINKSQILYSMNRLTESKKALEKAHLLFEQEQFTKILGEKNEQGKTLFD